MQQLFTLDAHGVMVPAEDTEAWRSWMVDYERRTLRHTDIMPWCYVSTVFFGVDVGDERGPIYYETRVIGGVLDDFYYQSATHNHAIDAHSAMVTAVRLAEGDACSTP